MPKKQAPAAKRHLERLAAWLDGEASGITYRLAIIRRHSEGDCSCTLEEHACVVSGLPSLGPRATAYAHSAEGAVGAALDRIGAQ